MFATKSPQDLFPQNNTIIWSGQRVIDSLFYNQWLQACPYFHGKNFGHNFKILKIFKFAVDLFQVVNCFITLWSVHIKMGHYGWFTRTLEQNGDFYATNNPTLYR